MTACHWACALALSTASLLAAAPAQAALPGANGSLASEYRQIDRGGDDDREIQVFALNGKVAARLSPCARPEFDPDVGMCPRGPSFSPNGKRIAFSREGRLAIADATGGTGLVTLAKLTASDSDPAFSPDGTKLVFTGLAAGKRNLYTVNLNGGGLRQLTRAGGSSPSWSSTGQIAYCAGGQVWRLRAPGSARARVASGCHPDWSPSGRSIVYDLRRSSYRVSIRTGAARKLVRRQAERPAFSPDGKRIAFQRAILINDGDDGIGASIYTVAAQTGKALKLIRRGGELPIGSTYGYFTSIAWQPLP